MTNRSVGSPLSHHVVRGFSVALVASAILLVAYVIQKRQPQPPFEISATLVDVSANTAHFQFQTSDPLFVYALYDTPGELTYALSPLRADFPHQRMPAGTHTFEAPGIPEAGGNLVLFASRTPVWWINEAIYKVPRVVPDPILDPALFNEVPLPADVEEQTNAKGASRLAAPLQDGVSTVADVWVRKTRIDRLSS